MSDETTIGRYAVIDRVGAGGMAEVFRCRQTGLGGFDKTVVIKRILPHLAHDPEFIAMFLDEARVAANLSHPNVVQVFEIDEQHGVPFIVMEYVRGPTLSHVFRAAAHHGRRHVGHVAKLIAGAADGLAHAHQACDASGQPLGIVHRDVSPHNVIVGLDGTPKVLDFGVARARGRLAQSQVGTLKGKLRFMAPEQISSADGLLDARADVYGLGVCLYLGTVGRLPFRGETDAAVMHAVMNDALVPPSTLVADYPPELERILLWALERDRARRCPDARLLHQALEAFTATGPHASSRGAIASWLSQLELDKVSSTAVAGGATPASSGARAPSLSTRAAPRTSLHPIHPTLALPAAAPADVVEDVDLSEPAPRGRLLVAALVVVIVLSAAGFGFAWLKASSGPLPPSAAAPAPASPDAARLVDEVAKLVGEGRYASALELAARVDGLGAPPEVSIALQRLRDEAMVGQGLQHGRERLAKGDRAGALVAVERVLERDPHNAEARALLLAASAPVSDGGTAAPTTATASPAPTKSRPAHAPTGGALLVTSSSRGEVVVDGVARGATPLTLEHFAPGLHVVEVRAAGFEVARAEVRVVAGRETPLAVQLARAPPPVAVAVAAPVEAPAAPAVVAAPPAPPADAKPPVAAEEAPKKPRLPATYTARSVKDLARVLSVVEGEAVAMGGLGRAQVAGATAALFDELGGAFAPGQTVELFPRGMYYFILKEAHAGLAPTATAAHLRSAHLRNELLELQ